MAKELFSYTRKNLTPYKFLHIIEFVKKQPKIISEQNKKTGITYL